MRPTKGRCPILTWIARAKRPQPPKQALAPAACAAHTHAGEGGIAEGELVTMYPGDALALWNETVGETSSIRDAYFQVNGASDSRWASKWKIQDAEFIAEAMCYAVRMGPTRAIIGDPAQRADAAYLGHMVNDAAMCVQPGTAKQVYEITSAAAANVGLDSKSRSGCHHAVVATRAIAKECEIFMSYGSSYWLARLPEPPKRYPFPDGSVYYGEVSDGQIHGHGEFTDAEGNRYVGEFANGSYQGVGTQFYLDGRAEACRYLAGQAVDIGVGWSPGRAEVIALSWLGAAGSRARR
jgi:hypothetical protein